MAPGEPARLDLNTATAGKLEGIPGIGPALAGRILAYRDREGPFRSLEDLDDVSGIGPQTLQRLAPYLSVGGGWATRSGDPADRQRSPGRGPNRLRAASLTPSRLARVSTAPGVRRAVSIAFRESIKAARRTAAERPPRSLASSRVFRAYR